MNSKLLIWILPLVNFLIAGWNLSIYINLENSMRYVNLLCFAVSSCVAVTSTLWCVKIK